MPDTPRPPASSTAPPLTPLRRDPPPPRGLGALHILDQRALPFEERWLTCTTAAAVTAAIRDMAIRGAPAIGLAGAYAAAIGARALPEHDFVPTFLTLTQTIEAARPTAVNLAWALARLRATAARPFPDHLTRLAALDAEADAIRAEDLAMNHAIGAHGLPLLPRFPDRPTRILTHCNTGSLATAGWGTALGVIRSAHATFPIAVFADETRPYLQGARLTAWELSREGIDVTLIPDSAAGHLLAEGQIDVVIVGADRIAGNGDTANKIGTYPLAILAAHHGVPFYVAAPSSSFDLSLPTGAAIPIEERSASEVLELFGHPIAPPVKVRNPAFDLTPGSHVTAFITERGLIRAPYAETLAKALSESSSIGSATLSP